MPQAPTLHLSKAAVNCKLVWIKLSSLLFLFPKVIIESIIISSGPLLCLGSPQRVSLKGRVINRNFLFSYYITGNDSCSHGNARSHGGATLIRSGLPRPTV